MPWSFPIARVFGIPIRVHATFFLLPLGVALTRRSGDGWRGGVQAALLVVVLFVFVVLHELGHSVVAKGLGVRIRDITLLPIGGVARMEDIPRAPFHEVLIAFAGPAVNFVLAAGFLILAFALRISFERIDPLAPNLLVQGVLVNLVLGAFNLVPAFPMDGGRVLRGLLASVMSFRRATRIAVTIGQVFGVAGIAIGVLRPGMFWLGVIGVFVFLGAGQEKRANALRFALEGVPVSRAMIQQFDVVPPGLSLFEVAERARTGLQEDFPVVEEGRLLGLLSKTEFLTALRLHPGDTPVGSVLSKAFVAVPPETLLFDLYRQMARSNTSAAAVVDGGRLTGLITFDRIGRFLSLRRGGSP